MPRNISFFLTKEQFLDGSKDVTRRLGWWDAQEGDQMMAVEKSQGLGKGGKIVQMGLIRLIAAWPEPLNTIVLKPEYGHVECRREGFPDKTPEQFVVFFCNSHTRCTPETTVMRLEFKRI